MPRSRSLPPDPSRPDLLSETIKQTIDTYLRDPLNYPPEMVDWLTQITSFNAIQSTTS